MSSNYTTVLSETVTVCDWSQIRIITPYKVHNSLQELYSSNGVCAINFRFETKDGKLTKIPYYSKMQNASSTDPSTWRTYSEALEALNDKSNNFNVCGIALHDSKLICIDVDHIIENGVVKPEFADIFSSLLKVSNTFTEMSQSWEGVHFFFRVEEQFIPIANKKAPFEVYSKGRFIATTGNSYHDEPLKLRTVSVEEMKSILGIIGYPWKKEVTTSTQLQRVSSLPLNVSDEELLKKMFSAKNGEITKALYSGDTSHFNNDASSADASLCSSLAFWTNKDALRIESMWLASPLGSRGKTQARKDYRDRTITFAIESCSEVYSPSYVNNDIISDKKDITEEVVTVEMIEELLHKIPADIPKVKLLEALNNVLHKLAKIDWITAEMFILNNIKDYFSITKGEARNYIPRVKSIKTQANKKLKAEKEAEDKLPLLVRDIDYQEAYNSILDIGIVSEEVFKIVTAVIVSSCFRHNPPLWLMLVGVPSSFKTELVGLYSDMDEVYTLDTLTENAFVSGYVSPDGLETQDLLPLLDEKSFIVKDLNTLFSMNQEMVKKILGDLTSIFDGQFEKFTATRGMISYNSLFSMIGCITPSILIQHYNYATQLGPRFFFLRPSEITEEEVQDGFKRSWNEKDRKGKVISTRQIVSSYTTQLIGKIKNTELVPESEDIQVRINNIALFICKARGVAISKKAQFTDDKGKEVDYYEITDWQVEQPWRILNQLKSLIRIICVINGNNTVGYAEISAIKPIIMSTMPVGRAEVIKVIVNKGMATAKEISNVIHKSPKTVQRTLKELYELDIIDKYKDPSHNAGKTPWSFYVHEKYSSILGINIPTPKSMSLTSRGYSKETSDFDDIEDEEFEDDSIFEVEPINKPSVKEDEPLF